MVLKIEKDHQRFRQIVKGRIREDLRKFLTKGELIGKEGKHLISIPVRGIELPHFRYGDNSGGVGAGDGKEGDVVGKGQGKGAQGGTEPGQHIMEVDLSLDELEAMIAKARAKNPNASFPPDRKGEAPNAPFRSSSMDEDG